MDRTTVAQIFFTNLGYLTRQLLTANNKKLISRWDSERELSFLRAEVVMYWNAGLPNSVIQRNVTAITPFKVIQGHRFWYQLKAQLILTYLLSCTLSKLWPIIGQIFPSERKVPHINAHARGDSRSISLKNYILLATFLSQKVSVYLQPLLRK